MHQQHRQHDGEHGGQPHRKPQATDQIHGAAAQEVLGVDIQRMRLRTRTRDVQDSAFKVSHTGCPPVSSKVCRPMCFELASISECNSSPNMQAEQSWQKLRAAPASTACLRDDASPLSVHCTAYTAQSMLPHPKLPFTIKKGRLTSHRLVGQQVDGDVHAGLQRGDDGAARRHDAQRVRPQGVPRRHFLRAIASNDEPKCSAFYRAVPGALLKTLCTSALLVANRTSWLGHSHLAAARGSCRPWTAA